MKVTVRFLKDWKGFTKGRVYEAKATNLEYLTKHGIAEKYEKPVEVKKVETAEAKPEAETAEVKPEVAAAKALYSKTTRKPK